MPFHINLLVYILPENSYEFAHAENILQNSIILYIVYFT